MKQSMKLIVTSTEGNEVAISTERTVAGDTEVRSYTLDPRQAVEFANAVMRAAEDCGIEILTQSAPIVSDGQRMALVNRAGLIMRSMLGKKPEVIALHIVDQILSQVAK